MSATKPKVSSVTPVNEAKARKGGKRSAQIDANSNRDLAGQELVLTRVFDAPRELVFKLWTDPKHVAQWWGPRDFTNPVCEMDVRPGGAMRIHMRGPDGVVYPGGGVFQEIVAPERLVFTSTAFEDAQGNPELEVLNTVTFANLDGKTRLTLHAVVVKASPAMAGALAGMDEGWSQSLDKLAEHIVAAQAEQQTPQPSSDLKRLDRLVGAWKISGGAQGTITYEWMEGGFFLIQRVELDHDGHKSRGIEIIGHERAFGATEPGEDIKSRYYGSAGETFDYVYELDGDTLTIWGGEKGSPAYYRGTFSADGNTLTGGWVWPGGGYESIATRVKRRG